MKFAAIISTLLLSACAGATGAEADVTGDVLSRETYVELHPREGYLQVREYGLGTRVPDEAGRRAQAKRLAELVRSAGYCRQRFGFEGFTSMEERIFHDRGFITAECHLLSKERNIKSLMHSVYGSALDRKVEVEVSRETIDILYSGAEVVVRSNNSVGWFSDGDRRKIAWRNGEPSQELVFSGARGREHGWTSLVPYLESDAASPEIPKSQVDALMEAP